MRRTVVVLALFCLSACTRSGGSALLASDLSSPVPTARQRMGSIENFVVYYGAGELDALARFDLAIIDPATLNRDEITDLRSLGTIVVGYLSVGEIEAGDPWIVDGTVPRSWILGRNPNWGSLYVDASQPGWQALMQGEAGKLLADYGFDGVFLDTVDTAIDVAPETGPGMVALIRGLRTAYPDAVVVQNRGFDLIPQVRDVIDAVMFEDLSTTYDFDQATYLRVEPDEEVVSMLADAHQETGMPILALDYADPTDRATAHRAVRIARSYGFVPAVATIELDQIVDYGTT